MMRIHRTVLLVLMLAWPAAGQALAGPDQGPWDWSSTDQAGGANASAGAYLQVKAIASHTQVTPGQTFYVAADIRIAKDWAYYSPNPGDSDGWSPLPAGMNVAVSSPSTAPARGTALEVGEPLWPPDRPHVYALGKQKLVNNAYEDRLFVYVPFTVGRAAAAGPCVITLSPQGQICGKDTCIRLEGVLGQVRVEVGDKALPNPKWTGAIAEGLSVAKPARQFKGSASMDSGSAGGPENWPVVLGLCTALLAGLILNIMPCVLPVIPLKVLSLLGQAGQSRRRYVTLGLAFAAGIVLFFAIIAFINMVLRLGIATFEFGDGRFEWGEHFQSTAFRMGMALLLVALAANLLGAFTVLAPRRLAAAEGSVASHGAAGALGSGLLTGILSTPCSFSYLAGAFAWAQSQPLWLGSVGIIAIGVGMAVPYAMLTAFPGMLRHLPRPGRWMELFKQSMGFVLLLVGVWLISTGAEDTYPFWVAGYGVVLSYCLWMWGAWVRYDAAPRRKWSVRTAAAVIAVAGGLFMLAPSRPMAVKLVPFNQAQIDAAHTAGRTVLVDFTARWCLTCKFVEHEVYNDRQVAAELAKHDVLTVRGDTTTRDMPAEKLRAQLGEAIPVTVIFPPGNKPPIRLRGVFSKEDLFRALGRTQQNR